LYLQHSNPKAGNSFSLEEARSLSSLLHRASEKTQGILWSSSSSRYFCTGGNLKDFAQLKESEPGLQWNAEIRQALDLLSMWPGPKVAWVEGDCFGGGMELLSCFDQVVASPSALLGFWQRRQALSFGWGGYQRWTRRIGEGLTEKLFLEARSLSAYEALDKGIVDEVQRSHYGLIGCEQWLKRVSVWPKEPLVFRKELSEGTEEKIFQDLWFNSTHKKLLDGFVGA
jgi:enoyl-CoA hydratase/carnithine racemase